MTDNKTNNKKDETTKLTLAYQGTEPGVDPETGKPKFRVVLSGELMLSSREAHTKFLNKLDDEHQIVIEV